MHGHRIGGLQMPLKVWHTSRTAIIAQGPAAAITILSRNCANAIMRPMGDVQIEYPCGKVDSNR